MFVAATQGAIAQKAIGDASNAAKDAVDKTAAAASL
jgi:hypothetical protein